MKRALLTLLIIGILAMVAQAAGPIVEFSILNLRPSLPQSGGIVEVQLLIQNTGGAPAEDIWVEAVPDYPFTLVQGYQTRQTIPLLPVAPERASSTTLTYKFHIDPETPEAEQELNFRYTLNKGQGWAILNFSIPVTSTRFSQNIEVDKTLLVPGKETPLTFTVHNLGTAPLQNAVFTWTDPKGIILPLGSGNSRYIGYLAPGTSMPLEYSVMASVNANPDLYTLNMTLKYDVSAANLTTASAVTTSVGMFVGGETDFDVAFSESAQGQTSLSIANIGITPAYSVTVRIPQQEGYRVDGTTTAIVGNLDKGDYTLVSFQITQTNGMNRTGQSRTETQPPAPSTQQRTLRALVEYTDTTGTRRTVEKYVPVQFRPASSATGTTQPGQFGRQAQTSSTSKYWWIAGVLIVLAAVYYFRKKIFRKRNA